MFIALHLLFIAIGPNSYDHIVLTKVIAEFSECGNIAKNRSRGATNTSCQMIRLVANKPTVYADIIKDTNWRSVHL